MAVRALLERVDPHEVGDQKWVVRLPASWSGIVEVQPGWLLCNGAVVPLSGASPAGYPYAPLNAFLGTRYGGSPGTLPPVTDGRSPVPRGAGVWTVEGQAAGAPSVTLALGEYPSHAHSVTFWWRSGIDSGTQFVDLADALCYQQYARHGNMVARSGSGGGPYDQGIPHEHPYDGYGAAHENMHPYTTVGCHLIRL